MNIFFIDRDPVLAARYHCDKHVPKMIVEYAQLMSTAHRLLDGEPYETKNKRGHKLTRWRFSDDREHKLYLAAHYNVLALGFDTISITKCTLSSSPLLTAR